MRTQRTLHRGYVTAAARQIQEHGRYGFGFDELLSGAPVGPEPLKTSIKRRVASGELRRVPPRGDYILIVPPEFRTTGAPPVSWWIDDWMRHCADPYYIGLLSAAEFHGSAHFAVMETQVVTLKQRRPFSIGRARLRFFAKTRTAGTPARAETVDRGSMRVSTPEATLLDLSRHINAIGGASRLALIAGDLARLSSRGGMKAALKANDEIAPAQRLGYVLDNIGAASLAGAVDVWLRGRRVQPIALEPGAGPARHVSRRWLVRFNASLETGA